ncbi:MAG: EAL domain-containing protein [Halofilum sp. (in: g-proteobacteria)]
MKLLRLSLLSIAGCLLGLALLVSMTVASYVRMQSAQEELAALLDLHHRLDAFSAASDALLLQGADAELWQVYVGEGQALRRDLRELGAQADDALRAADRIDAILAAMKESRITQTSIDGVDTGMGFPGGPLGLPLQARIHMNQVANHGIALDTAVDSLLRQRQNALARQTLWIGGGFAAAALLFGSICVFAFLLIHHRMVGPMRSLSNAIREFASGVGEARAPVTGNDELTEVSTAFNGLADQRQAAIANLEHNRRMLAESQRIAGIGSWQLRLEDMTLIWSEESYRLIGVNAESFDPTADAFFAYVHPDDRDRLLVQRERVLASRQDHDLEFRIVRSDGELRYVHERAEIEYDPAGRPQYLTGTIQDITEQRRLTDYLFQFRRLIEASNDRFAVIDSDLRYTMCNEAYAALFQRDCSAVEGHHLNEVLGALFGDTFVETEMRSYIERCLTGEPQILERQRTYPHLGTRQLLIRYYPLASPDGRIRQVGMVMTDLTELKLAEAKLREQQHLLDIAGRVARLGGWSVELADGRVTWSDLAAEIYGMPHGHSPGLEDAIDFYTIEDRERIRAHYFACAEQGIAFDDELELLPHGSERRWVRAAGEPVHDEAGAIVRVQGALQDITARRSAEREVTRLADRLGTILDSITDAFITVGPDWRLDYVNAAAEQLLGYSPGSLDGTNLWHEFPGIIGTRLEQEYRRAIAEHVSVNLEEYYAPLAMWLEVRAYPSEEGLAIFFRDVTERREMLSQLETQERELRSSRDDLAQALETRQALINGLPAHIALIDGSGHILDVNEQWRHFGQENAYDDHAYGVGRNYLEICAAATGDCAPEAAEAGEGIRAVLAGEREILTLEYACHAPGEQRWFRLMARRLAGANGQTNEAAAVVMHVDVTERKLAEQELNRLAYEDALTALPSRNGFLRSLASRIGASGWQPEAMVVVLDVRSLRDINDVHGYMVGDALLQAIARRLQERAGEDAIVARIGGDEFALFLPEKSGVRAETRRADIGNTFAQPFTVESLSLEATALYGYTVLDEMERNFEDLLREAELALFQSGRSETASAWMPYTRMLHDEARQRTRLTHDLRRALEREEFQLHFQPKVDLRSGRLVGSEALLRWMHPELGLQSPATFIPAAERSRLIGPIGDWAIHEACRCLNAWNQEGLAATRVSVNVSLVQFMLGDLTETVRHALDEYDIPHGGLTLEITESVFERESDNLLRQLRSLHEMGVRLSLDDFGTGYSSLLYLQKYPFDEIKIDRGFVSRMLADEYSRKIVGTVIGIAGGLGAEAIAEGVETAAVCDALVESGCYVGQGYYFSMPLEVEDFRWLLKKHTILPLAAGSQ